MERVPIWFGVGVVAAGVSVAALAGAGSAAAESDDTGPSEPTRSEQVDPGPTVDTESAETDDDTDPDTDTEDEDTDEDEVDEADEEPVDEKLEQPEEEPVDQSVDEATPEEDPVAEEPAQNEPVEVVEPEEGLPMADAVAVATVDRRVSDTATTEPVAPALSVPKLPTPKLPTPLPSPLPSPFAYLDQLPPVFKAFGSVVFDVLGTVTKVVTGPPQLPPGSTVTVRTSTLEIDGRRVSADWYFPDTDEPPTRIIYLQHGFLANGTMYSHTAAYLAERTNSVVVAPTLTSNPFRSDGFWLGGDPMYRAVAELFLGDREALSASAAAAGYTARYGADAVLPSAFILVGHSLGGGLVAGVSGHYARFVTARGEDNHLAGVISLDGVPPRNDIVRNSLDALDATGDYVPFLELHAPTNYLNSTSNITQALNAGRAGKFHGVELVGGVHMDSMIGGNPIIQLSAYLIAGIPRPQNPGAAQLLMAGWVNDMFAGRIDADTGTCVGDDCSGTYGPPGSKVIIPTPKGRATAKVLGVPVATTRPSVLPPSMWEPARSVLLRVA